MTVTAAAPSPTPSTVLVVLTESVTVTVTVTGGTQAGRVTGRPGLGPLASVKLRSESEPEPESRTVAQVPRLRLSQPGRLSRHCRRP